MKYDAPRIEGELETYSGSLLSLVEDAGGDDVYGYSCVGIIQEGEDFPAAVYRGVSFHGCHFSGSSFSHAEFIDVVFDSCDFSNCRFDDGYMVRCSVSSCRFTGAMFGKHMFSHVRMTNTVAPYISCDGSRWDHCRIEKTDLHGGSFFQAKLNTCEFDDADLAECIFLGTPLKGIDLSNSRLDKASFSDHFPELRGAVLNRDQAAELARVFGIKLAD